MSNQIYDPNTNSSRQHVTIGTSCRKCREFYRFSKCFSPRGQTESLFVTHDVAKSQGHRIALGRRRGDSRSLLAAALENKNEVTQHAKKKDKTQPRPIDT